MSLHNKVISEMSTKLDKEYFEEQNLALKLIIHDYAKINWQDQTQTTSSFLDIHLYSKLIRIKFAQFCQFCSEKESSGLMNLKSLSLLCNFATRYNITKIPIRTNLFVPWNPCFLAFKQNWLFKLFFNVDSSNSGLKI